jgi:Putative lumazine-binding
MTTDHALVHQTVPATDAAAIRATIDDYYLGWYDGDGGRMARALHPDLAKRGWVRGRDNALFVDLDTFDTMVSLAAAGHGRQTDAAVRAYDVRVNDVHGDIAAATVHAVPYVDYLHLIRTGDGWRILNALWCPA